MHKTYYFVLLFVFFITTFLSAQSPSPEKNRPANFYSPVDIPLLLSGNFGEIRSTHFHAGIDIKTQQVEGKNVLAADSGYVYRIAVQRGGYGNVLYMRHASGMVTVYAHLKEFVMPLEKYVKAQQYRKKSFEVDLYPEAGRFIFRQGQLLGLSGNSGNSAGPHVHFEIRDASGEIPMNPLNYRFAINDNTLPKIKWLMVYPLDSDGTVNGLNHKLPFQVSRNDGNHFLSSDVIRVSGNIGVGIETYDYLDHAANECSPYTIHFLLDDKSVLFCRFDSIPFSLAGYVNSHIDYEEKIRSDRKIQKLFLDPNNALNIYKVAVNRGVIQLRDTLVHNARIEVKDTYGNESVLNFKLRTSEEYVKPEQSSDYAYGTTRFYWDSLNVFENSGMRLAIPRGALFKDLDFRYAQIDNDSIPYSAIHQVHNLYTPLYTAYILSIRPRMLPASLHDKALLAVRGPKGQWLSLGGDYKNGFVTARVKTFGQFIVTVDTIPPEITPVSFNPGGQYRADQIISFSISDSLSGVSNYSGTIDNSWALFEYDAKNNALSYVVDAERLIRGKMHLLEIMVADNKGNINRYKSNFQY